MVAISIHQATLSYQNHSLFENLNLEIPSGSWAALLGESGVGKSSLLRLIAGLNSDNTNKILKQNPASQFAYMGQTDSLLPWTTVLDNVLLGIKLRSHAKISRQKYVREATELLEKIGLKHALSFYPHQLSGGMRQRVMLARIFMENKPIILMDEPFSALDTITRYKLHELAVNLLRDKTVLFVTHDPIESLRLAQEIYIMRGNPAQIIRFAKLISTTPRDLTNSELQSLQAPLFYALAQTNTLENKFLAL